MSDVIVTVTPEIDAALDAWARAILAGHATGGRYAMQMRLVANETIANAIAKAVETAREEWFEDLNGRNE